jgi:hypothetical protein
VNRNLRVHVATFGICLGMGLLVPVSVGAYRDWRAASSRRPPPPERLCVGVSEADLPDPLPPGTPFVRTGDARSFLGRHVGQLRVVKDALAGPMRTQHDRLVTCVNVAGREHPRMRILADWHLSVANEARASAFTVREVQGAAGPDRARIDRCFQQTFGTAVVVAALPDGPFRYAGTYPAPLILEL